MIKAHIFKHAGNMYDQKKVNHRLTVMLVAIFILYYLILGYATDVLVLNNDSLGLIHPASGRIPLATLVAAVLAGAYVLYCFFRGDDIILKSIKTDDGSVDQKFMRVGVGVVVLFAVVYGLFHIPGIDLMFPSSDSLGFSHRVLGYIPVVFIVAFILWVIGYAIYVVNNIPEEYLGEQPIQRVWHDDPVRRQLVDVVNEMSIASGIPMPAIYIVREIDPNVFATGRDAQHSTIVVTSGFVKKLDREQQQAAIAHAMAHIRNHDTRLLMLVTTLGMGSILLGVTGGAAFAGKAGAGARSVGEMVVSRIVTFIPGVILFLPFWLGLALFTTLTVRALELLISDERIFQADITAAELTRNPIGVLRALKELDFYTGPTESFSPAISSLCIMGPSGEYKQMDDAGFAFRFCLRAHPPMARRIEAVKELGFLQGPRPAQHDEQQENPVAS